ncbi:ketopantoate reductase family protein [Shewanella mangrovisoli]|uniref:ketopantoate reductase family protein n=1 Tax=Shewanella mangrovisoli TaxID=2864211 RepID=UPI0035B88337
MFGQGASSTVESQVTDVAILGAGAVGQLICHQLHSAGLAVGLIAREASATTSEATDWQELVFCSLPSTDADTDSVSYRVPTFNLDSTSLQQIRLLIVCVKAYQVIDAISPLLDKLSPQCHILLLHNGMGPHLALAPKLQGRGLSLGTTSQGVLRQSRWQVKQTGQGLTQFGHFTGPALPQALRDGLLNAIPNSEWVEAIISSLWQKLAVNAAINPLTALHQCPNGTLAQAQFTQTITSILDELVEVAAHDGIALDRQMLEERVYRVIELTAANFSSMHQDVAHHRPTEIEQISGYICDRASAHGLSAATNAQMCQAIKQLSAITPQA